MTSSNFVGCSTGSRTAPHRSSPAEPDADLVGFGGSLGGRSVHVKELQRLVQQIDEMAHVLVLPPCAALVHRVGEGDVGIRIGEPERAAGAEVPEGAGARTEPALRHGELEAETEAHRPLENYVFPVDPLGDRHLYRRWGQDVDAVQVAVARERRIEAGAGAGGPGPRGRGAPGRAPPARGG